MIVNVRSKIDAKRLDLDDSIETERPGSTKIRAPLEDLERILDQDNVSVKTVTLQRTFGDDEADVIDRLLLEHSGTVRQHYAYFKDNERIGTPKIQHEKRKLFKVSEDKVVIYTDYVDVVVDDYILQDKASFQQATHDFKSWADEKITELQQAIKNLETHRERDFDAESFFDDSENLEFEY